LSVQSKADDRGLTAMGGASLLRLPVCERGIYLQGTRFESFIETSAFLPLFAASACGSSSSVEHTNLVTTEQLNEISQNTSEVDDAARAATPATPNELGQSLRAGAAAKPRKY
jgi:hypothetical protein